MTAKQEVVYRQKAQGKGYPALGLPTDLRPGDYLTFLIDQAQHTRAVNSVHKNYVMVRPVTIDSGGQTIMLHKGRKVPFKVIVMATRLMTPEDYEAHLYLLANPPPPPPPKKAKEPKGKRGKRGKRGKKAVAPAVAVAPLASVAAAPPAPPPKPKPPPPKHVRRAAPTQADVMDIWAMLNDE